jgi:hypothetical protein
MAYVHGHLAVFKQASTDLSAFINSVEVKRKADDHDTTTLGDTAHEYSGGLTDGTITIKGIYDAGATTTPRVTVQGALGTVVAWTHQAAGTLSAKPQMTGNGLVTSYEESAPVDDMVTWSAEYKISGPVTITDQT